MLDTDAIDPGELRDAFGCFPSGVTVVGMRDAEGRATGVTVSSFASLSLDPPLCSFSLIRSQVSCRWIEAHRSFTVNILSSEQGETALQFAAPHEDKFAGIAWREGRNGMPVIEGALASFECSTWATYDGGDHCLIVGRIGHVHRAEGQPLLFCGGKLTGAEA